MMSKAFGTPGYVIQTFFQFIYPFIAMISYNVIVGDTITAVVVRVSGVNPNNWFVQREFIIVLTTLFVTLPLSLYKDIGKLAKSSFISLVLVAFILVAIIVKYFQLHEKL